MTIYYRFSQNIGKTWGGAVCDQNMTDEETIAEIRAVQKRAEDAGVEVTFQTPREILGGFLEEVMERRRHK